MKKVIVFVLFYFLTSFNTLSREVFICGSNGAKKYHFSETCRGLNACKHEIKKMALQDAKEIGLELCGWED